MRVFKCTKLQIPTLSWGIYWAFWDTIDDYLENHQYVLMLVLITTRIICRNSSATVHDTDHCKET